MRGGTLTHYSPVRGNHMANQLTISQQAKNNKQYYAPKLICLGTIAKVTEGGGGSQAEPEVAPDTLTPENGIYRDIDGF
jgi:hypothetical protein